MKCRCLLIAIVAVALLAEWSPELGAPAGRNYGGAPAYSPVRAEHPPKIFSARLDGKRLIVAGEHFADDAVILVNGEAQKTRNDEQNPETILIAKKAGKRIGPTDIVTLQVRNPDNAESDEVPFFGGLTITLADNGRTITLEAGTQFLLLLGEAYEWASELSDQTVLIPVPTFTEIPGSQGVYEAAKPGQATLVLKGEPLCSRATPPCEAPPVLFQISAVVR